MAVRRDSLRTACLLYIIYIERDDVSDIRHGCRTLADEFDDEGWRHTCAFTHTETDKRGYAMPRHTTSGVTGLCAICECGVTDVRQAPPVRQTD